MTQETSTQPAKPIAPAQAEPVAPAAGDLARDIRSARAQQRVPTPRPAGPRVRKRTGPRSFVYVLLGIGCLAAAFAAFLLVANPADLVRDRLAAHVKAHTGRNLSVRGGASLKFFPAFGIALRDVELSPPSGMSGPGTHAQTVDVRIAWRPLLEQRVVVEALTLKRPVFEFAVDAEGRRSWDFALLDALLQPSPVRLAQAEPRPGFGQALPPEMFETLRNSAAKLERREGRRGSADATALAELRIEDGIVRYSDARNGAKHEASDVNLRAGLTEPAAPLTLTGSLVWQGERVRLDGQLDNAAAAIARRPVRAGFKLAARDFGAAYDGAFSLTDVMALDGRLTATSRESGALGRWLRAAGVDAATLGNITVEGNIRTAPRLVELTDATITVAGVTASGAVSVEMGRARPIVKAEMQVAELDLDRVSSKPHQEGRKPRAEAEGNSPPSPDARSIDDLLKHSETMNVPPARGSGPQVRGFLRRAGGSWSTDPVHLAGLRTLDLDGNFQIGRTAWRELKFGRSLVHVALEDGRLRADIRETELYEGRGKGVLALESEGSKAVVSLNATVNGVAAGPLMKDLADFDWVEGHGSLSLAITGQGATEKEIIESLGGQAEFKVADGAVLGWDVTRSLRELRQGKLPNLDRDPAKKTPFHELSGTMAVARGVITNRDLKLTGQPVNLSGAGTIGLPERTVDYTVLPKLAAGGQTGGVSGDLANIEIPVHIRGPWAKPAYSADVASVLKDPRTAEKLQQLGRQVRSGNVDEAVKSVLGDGPEAEKKAAKAKEFLKRFMKP